MGIIYIEVEKDKENELVEHCLNLGADDVEIEENLARVECSPLNFGEIREGLVKLDYKFLECGIEEVPTVLVKLETDEGRKNLESLVKFLEEDDDIQKVWTNLQED